MKTLIENGFNSREAEPVKTTLQSTINFIAIHALPASLNVVLFAVWSVLALQVWEMFQ